MGRLKTLLGVLGAALFTLGLLLTVLGAPSVYAQDEEPAPAEEQPATPAGQAEPAQYEGSRECRDCHREAVRDHQDTAHALALQDTGRAFAAADRARRKRAGGDGCCQ